MIKVEQIKGALNGEDLHWLQKSCEKAWDGNTPEILLNSIAAGQSWLFRVSGDAEGVFVLTRGNPAKRELIVSALGGKGFIKSFPEIFSKIKALAKSNGSKKLSWFASRRGHVEMYSKRMKSKIAAVLYVEDLS